MKFSSNWWLMVVSVVLLVSLLSCSMQYKEITIEPVAIEKYGGTKGWPSSSPPVTTFIGRDGQNLRVWGSWDVELGKTYKIQIGRQSDWAEGVWEIYNIVNNNQ